MLQAPALVQTGNECIDVDMAGIWHSSFQEKKAGMVWTAGACLVLEAESQWFWGTVGLYG